MLPNIIFHSEKKYNDPKKLQKWKLESVYQLFHFICEKWIPKDGEFIQGHIDK